MPQPSTAIGCGFPLFSSAGNDWLSRWQANYGLETEKLEGILQGKFRFFGYSEISVGTPIAWHVDPVSHARAPMGYGKRIDLRDTAQGLNVKMLWELGRHQHLIPLTVAYAVTKKLRYKQAVVRDIEGWITENPYGMGIHWASALEVSLRIISWSIIQSLLQLSDGGEGLFSEIRDRKKFGNAVYQHVLFIRSSLSRFSSANNHLIGELTGLWIAGHVFDLDAYGLEQIEFAQKYLERETQNQVFDDGVSKEQSLYYHLWVLEYLLFARLVGSANGRQFSMEFDERIVRMAGFIRDVSPLGTTPPQIGDADDGMVIRFELSPRDPYYDVISAVGRIFSEPSLCYADRALPQKAFWYELINRQAAPKPNYRVLNSQQDKSLIVYPCGGYAIWRANPFHVVFDVGPLGYLSIAAHAHADALNICVAVDGDWFLVDPGTYAYGEDSQWREYFRSTYAHNSIVVDNISQSKSGGPFLWLNHGNARLEETGLSPEGCRWARASHDGYRKLGVVHRRTVQVCPDAGRLEISDFIDGSGLHEVSLFFHFARQVTLIPDSSGWLAQRTGARKMVRICGSDNMRWEVFRGSENPMLGWYSGALGSKEPIETLAGVWHGSLPFGCVTTFTAVEST